MGFYKNGLCEKKEVKDKQHLLKVILTNPNILLFVC